MIMKPLEPYVSPVGSGLISSRAAKKEDLKRSGSREVDPSEFKPTYHNKDFAKKLGKEWAGDLPKAHRLPTVIGPDVARGEQ